MRARKEERNQAMLEDRKKGMYIKDIAEKYGLCFTRTRTILINQARSIRIMRSISAISVRCPS